MATLKEVLDYTELRRAQCEEELALALDRKNHEVASNCERAIKEFDLILKLGGRKFKK